MPNRTPEMNLPGGITVRYVEVTPAMATEMLDRNQRNRKVSDRTKDAYVRSMENENWEFVGDPIRFADTGLLLDGQHRLLAVEASGVPQCFLVIEGLDEDTQKYIDGGRRRTAGDQLFMEGVTNGRLLGASARLLLQWERWRTRRGAITPGNAEIIEYVQEHMGILNEGFNHARAVYTTTGASRPAVTAAFVRALELTDDVFVVSAWFTSLATGENLVVGQPMMTLRNTLNRDRGNADSFLQLYQIVRTWNADQSGEGLGKLQTPRGGLSITNYPDMILRTEEKPSEVDERAAETLERLRAERRRG